MLAVPSVHLPLHTSALNAKKRQLSFERKYKSMQEHELTPKLSQEFSPLASSADIASPEELYATMIRSAIINFDSRENAPKHNEFWHLSTGSKEIKCKGKYMRQLDSDYNEKFRCRNNNARRRMNKSECKLDKSYALWKCESCCYLICTKCLNPYREEEFKMKVQRMTGSENISEFLEPAYLDVLKAREEC